MRFKIGNGDKDDICIDYMVSLCLMFSMFYMLLLLLFLLLRKEVWYK